MKKRLLYAICAISIMSILASVLMVNVVFYNSYQQEMQENMRDRAQALRVSVDALTSDSWGLAGSTDSTELTDSTESTEPVSLSESSSAQALQAYFDNFDLRVTLVEPSGKVAYDNRANPATMTNHADRSEIATALERGFGESSRHSDTISQQTYYYAVRLQNGQILRLALTASSMYSFLYDSLILVGLLVLLFVVVAILFARGLSKRIVAPINAMDLENFSDCPYEELGPMVQTLRNQKKELSHRLLDIEFQSETMKTIIHNMHGGVMLVDTAGDILLANKQISNTYHFPLEECDDYNVLKVCRDLNMLEGLKACKRGLRREFITHKGERVYRTYMSPVESAGTVAGAIILLLDVTEQMGLERFRREFSANVSHELKTPLTSILGYSELMAGGLVSLEDMPAVSKSIMTETKRLIQLIEDILELSRLDEGNYAQDTEEIELYPLCLEIVARLNQQLEHHKVTATVEGNKHLSLQGNRAMIDTLLYNIISNGIKYNKEGGTLAVSLAEEHEEKVICIADTGLGISSDDQQRIFERFYRVDSSRSRQTGGTGLGLAIAKHITRLHHGTLQVESTEGKGSTFTLRF